MPGRIVRGRGRIVLWRRDEDQSCQRRLGHRRSEDARVGEEPRRPSSRAEGAHSLSLTLRRRLRPQARVPRGIVVAQPKNPFSCFRSREFPSPARVGRRRAGGAHGERDRLASRRCARTQRTLGALPRCLRAVVVVQRRQLLVHWCRAKGRDSTVREHHPTRRLSPTSWLRPTLPLRSRNRAAGWLGPAREPGRHCRRSSRSPRVPAERSCRADRQIRP